MKYQTQMKVVEAEQYEPGKKLDLDIEVIKYEGVGGYAGRLVYIKNPRGELITVRPQDWVVLEEGKHPAVMTNEDFVNTYELTKQVKRAKKSATVADNVELKAPTKL